MNRPYTAVLAAVTAFVAACAIPQSAAGPTPLPTGSLPSPDPDRIELLCEQIADHKALEPFVSDEEGEFPHNSEGTDEHHFCLLIGRTDDPVKGDVRFFLTVDVAELEDDPPGEGPPNLQDCYGTDQCWIGGPDECIIDKQPKDVDYRNFVTAARLMPYDVEVRVGVWPDNFTRDLCEADHWSRAASIELLNEALHYLATGS